MWLHSAIQHLKSALMVNPKVSKRSGQWKCKRRDSGFTNYCTNWLFSRFSNWSITCAFIIFSVGIWKYQPSTLSQSNLVTLIFFNFKESDMTLTVVCVQLPAIFFYFGYIVGFGSKAFKWFLQQLNCRAFKFGCKN